MAFIITGQEVSGSGQRTWLVRDSNAVNEREPITLCATWDSDGSLSQVEVSQPLGEENRLTTYRVMCFRINYIIPKLEGFGFPVLTYEEVKRTWNGGTIPLNNHAPLWIEVLEFIDLVLFFCKTELNKTIEHFVMPLRAKLYSDFETIHESKITVAATS